MSNNLFYDLKFRSQITDLKRRKKYVFKELNNIVLKAVLETSAYKSSTNDLDVRFLAEERLQNLKQNTLTRVRNRCVLTGRSSTLKQFRLSRISFREHAGSGKLMGVSKRLNK